MCEPRKDAEVKRALEKLWQFASVDSNTIHQAIVRLQTIYTQTNRTARPYMQLDLILNLQFFIAHFVTAQEKLCLFVMSLPANHLCLEPVVRAIEVSSVDNSHVASYM